MKKRIAYLLPLAAVALLGAGLVATAESGNNGKGKQVRGKNAKTVARAALKDAAGARVGQVRLVERRNGKVAVSVRARGLAPGFHGFHVHETGTCEPPSFASAGGHLKLEGQDHGAHAGDMPPLVAMKDGKARAAFVTDSFRVSELLAGDGSAVMIHAGRDNLANIPARYQSGTTSGPDAETLKTGDSGSRTACGVVQRRKRR